MRTVSEPNGPVNGFDPELSDSSAAGGAIDGEPGGSGGFAVSVCLRRVLGAADPRARCLVWVEPERRVRCLLRRLRRLCSPIASADALATELCLLVRGHWLPPEEPLALLRPGDQLELVPVEESQLGEEISESRGAGGRPAPGQTRGPREGQGKGDGAGGEGSSELERGKKRALGLLDQYEAEAGVRAPPSARRRRRCRRSAGRREPATAPCPSPATVPAPGPVPEASHESRAPRIIRAMSVPPPPVAPSPVTTDVSESTEAPE